MKKPKIKTWLNLLNIKDNDLPQIFARLTDKELISFLALNYYKEIYQNVYFNVYKVKHMPLEPEDITNEFLSFCIPIIRKYKYEDDASFLSYLKVIIKNFCFSTIKYWCAKKRFFASNMVSFEDLHYVKDEDAENKFNMLIDNLDYKNFYEYLNKKDKNKMNLILSDAKDFCSPQKIN